MTYAKIIADSVSPAGIRLTTMEVRMHRFVLAEFNTHRVFSRNSASSRAIPFQKQVARVLEDPAIPVSWPAEQSGMQGGDELGHASTARFRWLKARDAAVKQAQALHDLGVHKSVVNRLLEPFMWHTVIVTATEWDGFWAQRCSPLAQPEIRVAAEAMREAYDASELRLVLDGGWHLPYIDEDELDDFGLETSKKISAARCARVSYLTHDGRRDPGADLDLYERLISAEPAHASPLEHVATPDLVTPGSPGNFRGWQQLRHWVLGNDLRIADGRLHSITASSLRNTLAPMSDPIKVTVTDPDTGEVLGEHVVDDDYLVICAGNRYVAHTNAHANGTHVLTIKVDGRADG